MDNLRITYNHCEYDSDSDTMTTTGQIAFAGKQYDAEFTEHAGQSPIITVSNDSAEMSYSNGATVDGYGLSSTEEGKALYDAASKIYQAMYDKADEYQRENVDAICARVSYENQSIDDAEISIVAIEKNTGDIGDLHGTVMVGDDAFRFLADKDGSILSLMPQGAMMIDVNALPLTEELKSAICDAIRDGIVTEMEREEAHADDMQYPPVSPKEIKGMTVDEVIEYCDWSITEDKYGNITLESFSPAGENLVIETTRNTLVQDIKDYAETFDPDEHVEMWADSRGKNGVPESLKVLVQDADDIQEKYFQLANAVEIADRENAISQALGVKETDAPEKDEFER